MKCSSGSNGCCSLEDRQSPPPENELLCRAAVVTARSWRSQPVPQGVAGIFCRQRWFARYARSECRWCLSF